MFGAGPREPGRGNSEGVARVPSVLDAQSPVATTKGPAARRKMARPVPSSWQTRCGVRSAASTDPQPSRQSNLSDLGSPAPGVPTASRDPYRAVGIAHMAACIPTRVLLPPLGVGRRANGCHLRANDQGFRHRQRPPAHPRPHATGAHLCLVARPCAQRPCPAVLRLDLRPYASRKHDFLTFLLEGLTALDCTRAAAVGDPLRSRVLRLG